MKLLISGLFLALFIYISLNSLLICVLAYGIYIISTSPKLPSPKLSLDFWMQTEKFFGRDAFYRLSYALYRQHRNTLYQKMNVVCISSNFNKVYLKPTFNIATNFNQTFFNLIRQHASPIFYRTNQMVQQQILIMTFMNMLTHKTNIRLGQNPEAELRGILLIKNVQRNTYNVQPKLANL